MANISLKKKLEGKVAIITGGASGIGEATAHHFAEHGARAVVIADIQDERGRAVAESIGTARCSYVHCDVTHEEQVKSLVDWTAKTYGGIDVMFSNAGVVSYSKQSILELDFSEFDHVVGVNARGMAVCVKQAARKMIELGTRGTIVCTASVAATAGAMSLTDYYMSKHAVLGLVRSASLQLGLHGIRVNCVSPSMVLTPLVGQLGLTTAGDVENVMVSLTSLKGVVLTAAHVAEAVVFLASDASAFVTGLDIKVDGGLISMPPPNRLLHHNTLPTPQSSSPPYSTQPTTVHPKALAGTRETRHICGKTVRTMVGMAVVLRFPVVAMAASEERFLQGLRQDPNPDFPNPFQNLDS
ncbi:hypothetical protein ACS0TY_025821 [Phlomoides rotata]